MLICTNVVQRLARHIRQNEYTTRDLLNPLQFWQIWDL